MVKDEYMNEAKVEEAQVDNEEIGANSLESR